MSNQYNNKMKNKFILLLLVITFLACNSQVKDKKEINMEGVNTEAKIDSLLNLMTLEEKIAMIHAKSPFVSAGVKRLGIPDLIMSDGPYGVRPEQGDDFGPKLNVDDEATYLPKGLALASTWNAELGYEFGKVLGSEAKERGKDVILGPGVNITRSPLNGRNFEYLGEDPYLASIMAVGYIKGVQDQGVAASVKHYLANNQEFHRGTVNVIMSERALREIYLPAFKASVQDGKVLTVMGSYNKFRGQYSTHNQYLINDVLKKEFGFEGLVVSDWGAVHNTKEAMLNGTDIEMGTDIAMLPKPKYNKFYLADSALKLVKNGEIPIAILDDKVRRILRVMFKTNMSNDGKKGERNTKEHQKTALKIAEEGIVLLKNDNILPLNLETVKSIAVIGDNANHKHSMGGGSSQIKAKYEITPLEGLKTAFGDKVKITYAEGYKISKNNKIDEKLIAEAVKLAKSSEIAIVVGGWIQNWTVSNWNDNVFDSEAVDKPDMNMPFGQDKLIQEVIKANPNTIVVLIGGGPVDMNLWVTQAKGIIQAWYPGMEGGNALASIILGKVNPSGKLPMSFPKKLEDCPAHKLGEFPGKNDVVNYFDDIFVGYRYYDTYKVAPQFSFGHGLSYTTFEYSDIKLIAEGKNLKVSFSVKNTGKVKGAEVTQVYVNDIEASVKRPEKELKGFSKVFLAAGESKKVEMVLNENAFSFYDETKKAWVMEPGEFKIMVGSSSSDIRLTESVKL